MDRWFVRFGPAVVAFAVLGAGLARPPVGASHDADGAFYARLAAVEMLALINDFRAGRGLDPLGISQPLGAAATHKSEEMVRKAYFRHVSPEGVTPRDLAVEHGYERPA